MKPAPSSLPIAVATTGSPRSIVELRLALLLLVAACSSAGDAARGAGTWNGSVVRQGDTVTVTTAADSRHDRVRLDSVIVLWRSDSLDRPTQLLLIDDSLLLVVDRTRLFVVNTRDGQLRATLGAEGEGPGEFLQVAAAGFDGTNIVAVDRRNRHWNAFTISGHLVGSGVIAGTSPLLNLLPGRLVVRDSALLLGGFSLGSNGAEPSTTAVVALPLSGGGAQWLTRMVGQTLLVGASGSATFKELFGPNPRYAIANDGRIALGDGVDYCIPVSRGNERMLVCREWQRVEVTEAVRHPDYNALIAASGRDMDTFGPIKEVLDQAIVGDVRNSYTALHFDRDGRLWVQVVDSLSVNVHPVLGRFVPEQLPRFRHYDVFAIDGKLQREVLLPSEFTPSDASGNSIYGLYETPEGDLAVGIIRLP